MTTHLWNGAAALLLSLSGLLGACSSPPNGPTPGPEDRESELRAELEARTERLGPEDPAVATAQLELGVALNDRGRHTEAEELCTAALLLRLRLFDKRDALVAESRYRAAQVYADLATWPRAETHAREALLQHRRLYGDDALETAGPMTLLGRVLVARRMYRDALPFLERAYRVRRAGLPLGDWRTAHTASVFGADLAGLGRFEEAEVLLLQCPDLLVAGRGERHPRTLQALERIAVLYEAQGLAERAAPWRERLARGTD